MTENDDKSQREEPQNQTDNELWSEYTKNIEPLKNKDAYIENTQAQKKSPSHKQIKECSPLDKQTNKQTNKGHDISNTQNRDLDHKTAQKLRRGQLPIEDRLDLHGLTQNQAYDALIEFIPNAYHNGKRCVLIVTGKGYARHGDTSLLSQKPGILRQKTPEWLNSTPLVQYVLKVQPSRPNHGGEGALYVLLRRKRE